MAESGESYEILTQQIFQDILNQSDVKTIDVQQNVTIKGKGTEHQIDVYWKFELNGIVYETVVQAKDWASPVSQGELLKFKAVLDDIPGQPKGIFVTRTGYQKGARDFAAHNGIELYELRSPTDADFEGRVRTIHLHIVAHIPSSSGFKPIFDNEWIAAERQRLAIPDIDRIPITISGRENEIHLYDEAGNPVTTLWHEIEKQLPEDRNPCPISHRKVIFNDPRYLETYEARFPRVKIRGYEVDVQVSEVSEELILKAEDIVGFILGRAATGAIRKFGKDGKEIRKESEPPCPSAD